MASGYSTAEHRCGRLSSMQKVPWDCSYFKDPTLYMILQWVAGVSNHAEIIKELQCISSRYLQQIPTDGPCSMTSAIAHEVLFTMRIHNFWYSE